MPLTAGQERLLAVRRRLGQYAGKGAAAAAPVRPARGRAGKRLSSFAGRAPVVAVHIHPTAVVAHPGATAALGGGLGAALPGGGPVLPGALRA